MWVRIVFFLRQSLFLNPILALVKITLGTDKKHDTIR
jgi:hypothetical protein